MVDELGGKGNVVVFNVFFSVLCICGICYDQWKYVFKDYLDIYIIQFEFVEQFVNLLEDVCKKIFELFSQYLKGKLDVIYVVCWD